MRAELAEIYRVTKPVYDEGSDECFKSEYRSLSERDQLVYWYAYEAIDCAAVLRDDPAQDVLDAAVLDLAKEGVHYPEHLVAYARSQAHALYSKALRKGEPDELVDAYDRQRETLAA